MNFEHCYCPCCTAAPLGHGCGSVAELAPISDVLLQMAKLLAQSVALQYQETVHSPLA